MHHRYKVKNSETDEYTVYRRFYYTPRQIGIKKLLATSFTAIAFFLLIPLPDELIIVPSIAKALQLILQTEFDKAAMYAYAVYKGTGILFLSLALIFGAQCFRQAMQTKIKIGTIK